MGSFLFCTVICSVFWILSIFHDRMVLDDKLIRIHVVANSDSKEDQMMKLRIRDVICASIERDLQKIRDPEEAMRYLQYNIPKLCSIANHVLEEAGFEMYTTVSLCKEEFPARIYDTFRLPAGVYETLRISIGEGRGENWWCVVFPSFCAQSSASEFEEAAICAGLSPASANCLKKTNAVNLRFLILDTAGKLAALFHE